MFLFKIDKGISFGNEKTGLDQAINRLLNLGIIQNNNKTSPKFTKQFNIDLTLLKLVCQLNNFE